MKLALAILCLSFLPSCSVVYSAWGAAYDRQGEHYKKIRKPNLYTEPGPTKPSTPQPTYF